MSSLFKKIVIDACLIYPQNPTPDLGHRPFNRGTGLNKVSGIQQPSPLRSRERLAIHFAIARQRELL